MSLNQSICSLTVSEYLQNWLDKVIRDNVKRGTFTSYANTVKKRIVPYLGQKLLAKLCPKDIDTWLRSLTSAGFAHSTLTQTRAVLSTALRYAVYPAELIFSNPCGNIAIPRTAPRHVIKRTIVTENMLKQIQQHYPIGHKYRLPLLLAYHTGMRISEILGLDWQEIDIARGRLTVKKQLLWDSINGDFYFDTPKSEAGCRTILLDGRILQEIQAWQRIQRVQREQAGENWLRIDSVCTDCHGRPLRYASLERSLQKSFGLNTHSFRHTHATKLIEGGASPIDVAARLGHSSAELVNNVYTHDTENMQWTTLAIWDKVLGNDHIIGNNISNVNTTGFKSSRVTFADTLNQTMSGATAPKETLGGVNPKQVGLGSGVASVDLLFSDGTVQSTGKNTDLCLSGNGLFVVKNGSETYYTRDGAFEFDASGNYVLPGSGLYVQGWNGTNGTINTNSSVTNIQVTAGKSMASKASTTISYANNLDASEEAVSGISLSDSNGNVVTINASDTSSYVVGGTYSATINNSAVTFSNGISLPYANGSYAMQGNYALSGNSTVTLASGDKISVPATSSATYRAGSSLSGMSVSSVTTQVTGSTTSGTVTLSDNAVITNDSGTEYTGTMTNGDTFTLPVTTTPAETFTKGNPLPELEIKTISGKDITLKDGTAISNVSNTTYTATLASGDTVTIPSTATGTYAKDSNFTGTVTSVRGTKVFFEEGTTLTDNSGATSTYTAQLANGNTIAIAAASTKTYTSGSALTSLNLTVTDLPSAGTATLSDGSTLNYTTGTYAVGDTVTGQITSIAGFTPSNIDSLGTYGNTDVPDISIINLPTSAVSSISGKVSSSDGTTDTFNTTSGYLKSSEGMTVNDIVLTTDTGTVDVAGNDTAAYKTGNTYSSTISSVGLTMSDGTTSTQNSGSYTIGSSLPITTITTIYDTLGNAHPVTLFFTKTKVDSENGNQWTVSVAIDGSGTNTISESDGSTTTVTMSDVTLQFDTTGKYSSGSGSTATLTLTNGATGTQTITVDLSALTQYAGNNTVNGNADGNAAGTLKSISIDSSGIIRGTYTNGVVQDEAQVAVAQFTNASGLTKTGGSLYQASNNSGTANVKTAADLGVDITPSSLEMSNVDIANEFSDMIITQRGFQSNSKIITVGDEMLETVINMKR